MIVKRTHRLPIITIGMLILLCTSGAQAATINSTWICGTDNYCKATCWDPPLAFAPYNRGTLTFNVNIPSGAGTISMDCLVGPCVEVDSFILGEGRTFKVPGDKCYSVKGQADIYGCVDSDGGRFIAPIARFPGCKAQAWVDGGGYVEIGAPSYCVTGLNAPSTDYILFSSDGMGSVLNLSAMAELNDGVVIYDACSHSIVAQNGGLINLSALKNIIGPKDDDVLKINVNSGAVIRLDSLATVSHAGDGGVVRFMTDGDVKLALPSLTSVSSTEFHVSKGAKVIAGSSAWTYSAVDLGAGSTNYTLLSSDGARSVLDLSGMTELNDGVSIYGVCSHSVVAQDGGEINLSRLKNIIGPRNDDVLQINVSSDARIKLDNLATVSHARDVGIVRFTADAGATLALPSLTSVSSTQFYVSNGAKLRAGSSAWTYSATGLNGASTDYTLVSADGQGSVLDLSGMTEFDDSIVAYGPCSHSILARNGGVIDLSGMKKIIGPKDDESLVIGMDNGTIDLSSLQTITGSTGKVAFNIDHGGQLTLGNVRAYTFATVTFGDPRDVLLAVSDLGLAAAISMANPGHGMLVLKGDFTHSHTQENKVPFAKSYVFFNGDGPQEFEVGGLDIDLLWEELASDNFGFGQMVIGEPNRPTAVFLVDRIDNSNRGGLTGYEEALYLFGKKANASDPNNGLRILGGSVLYMGGLPVYALVDGVRTDLRTLFGPNDVMIPFDEGYLCLGKPSVNDPRNLVCNGGFETGKNPPTTGNCLVALPEGSNDIECWVVARNTVGWTHESCFADAGEGERLADLSSKTPSPQGSAEGQTQAVSQVIQSVPGRLYHVWFDVAVNPCKPAKGDTGLRSVTVSAASASEKFVFDSVTQVNWQTRTWRFRATDATTTLTFTGQDEPTTGCGVAIDNVIVLDPNDRDGKHTLTVSSTRGGSVVVSSAGSEVVTVIGPGKETRDFGHGELVTLTPRTDSHFIFGRWTGLQPGDIKEEDPNSNSVTVVMNRDITANASFHDLIVKIADIDTSGCPMIQATVMVTRANGDPVTGLEGSSFKVYEDGVLQTPITVGPRTSCVDVSLVLDYSASMGEITEDTSTPIGAMQAAAVELVNNMLPQDWGEVIKFALGVEVMREYTPDKDKLREATKRRPTLNREGTYLYNAICKAISDTAAQSCRNKAVVVITDGADTGSRDCDEDGVISSANLAGIPVFTIGLGDQINESVLRRIAEETGGVYYDAPTPDQLKDIYDRISETLNNQYLVSYETGNCPSGVGDNREHTLRIEVKVNESTGEGEKPFRISPAQAN